MGVIKPNKLPQLTDGGTPLVAGLGVYMTLTIVTEASLSTETDDAIVSVTPTTSSVMHHTATTSEACEACGETPYITSVTDHTTTAVTGVSTTDDAFVKGVTLTETTEEILIPIVMTDNLGNAHIVLKDVQPEYPITNSSPPSA